MGHSCQAALSDPAAPANSPSKTERRNRPRAQKAKRKKKKKKRNRGQALVRRRAAPRAPQPLRAVFVTDEEVGRSVGRRAGNAVRHVNLVLARAVGAEARLHSRLMRCLSERWEGSAALDSAPKPHLSAPGKKQLVLMASSLRCDHPISIYFSLRCFIFIFFVHLVLC